MCNINLFTYGSLMNLNELENMFGDVTYEKCWLSGYVRDFSKIAHSWGDEKDVGVLGIMPEPTKKVNGLLISNLSKSDLDKYAKRETGYEFNVAKEKETKYIFVNVDKSRIKSYKNKSINISDNIITVVTSEVPRVG